MWPRSIQQRGRGPASPRGLPNPRQVPRFHPCLTAAGIASGVHPYARGRHGAPHLDRDPELRPAERAGVADVGGASGRHQLPDARFTRQQSRALRAGQRRDRRGSALEGRGQGLRVRQGQLRGAGAGRHPLGRTGKPRDGGGRSLRRCRDDPAGLLREALHPGAGEEGREGLRAAARNTARHGQGRHRAGGDPHARIPGGGAAAGRCAGADAAALSAGTGGSRGLPPARRRHGRLPDQCQGAGDGEAVD